MQFMCVDKKKRNGNGQDKNGKTQTFQRDEESNALIFRIDCEVSFAWLDYHRIHTLEPISSLFNFPMSRTRR